MGPETRFKQLIRDHLAKNGWDVQAIETSTGRGVPDLSVAHPKVGDVWIEVKYGDRLGRERPEQVAWKTRGAMRGRRCITVWGWKESGWLFWLRVYTRTGQTYTLATNNLHETLFDNLWFFK